MRNNGCPFHYDKDRGYAPEDDAAYSRGATYNGNTVCDSCASRIEHGDASFPKLYLNTSSKRIMVQPRIERVEVDEAGVPLGGWGSMNSRLQNEGWQVSRVNKDDVRFEADTRRSTISVELIREVG